MDFRQRFHVIIGIGVKSKWLNTFQLLYAHNYKVKIIKYLKSNEDNYQRQRKISNYLPIHQMWEQLLKSLIFLNKLCLRHLHASSVQIFLKWRPQIIENWYAIFVISNSQAKKFWKSTSHLDMINWLSSNLIVNYVICLTRVV